MLLKLGVDISRLRREIRSRLPIIEATVVRVCHCESVLTCTFAGDHGPGSLHYADMAVDVRLPSGDLVKLLEDLKRAMGPGYDVVRETDHIHIEFDPKGL